MSHHETKAKGPDARAADRMVFFTDAVFAIVLTLLVLELRPPPLEDGAALWPGLIAETPKFIAFAISFALIGGWWFIHQRATRNLVAFDPLTAVLNLVLLFCIALMPFAAALFGEHVERLDTLAVYWAVSAASAYAMTAMTIAMTRDGGRLVGGMTARERGAAIVRSAGPAVAFTVGVWSALAGLAWVSRFCWMAIPPVMALAGVIRGRAPTSA